MSARYGNSYTAASDWSESAMSKKEVIRPSRSEQGSVHSAISCLLEFDDSLDKRVLAHRKDDAVQVEAYVWPPTKDVAALPSLVGVVD